MTEEATIIGSLFQTSEGKPFFCSLYAPGTNVARCVLSPDSLYSCAEGPTAEDAVYEARKKLWGNL